MTGATQINLTQAFGAVPDAFAKRQGPMVAKGQVVILDAPQQVWDFMRSLGHRFTRVIYRCEDGTIRDIGGQQGVHDSKQDGAIQGTGSAMACPRRLNLSFWTQCYGRKVNTGSGLGYRTLKASRILAINVNKQTFITNQGMRLL